MKQTNNKFAPVLKRNVKNVLAVLKLNINSLITPMIKIKKVDQIKNILFFPKSPIFLKFNELEL